MLRPKKWRIYTIRDGGSIAPERTYMAKIANIQEWSSQFQVMTQQFLGSLHNDNSVCQLR